MDLESPGSPGKKSTIPDNKPSSKNIRLIKEQIDLNKDKIEQKVDDQLVKVKTLIDKKIKKLVD